MLLTKERPIGPILLIGAGVLLLLHNFDWFSLVPGFHSFLAGRSDCRGSFDDAPSGSGPPFQEAFLDE